MLKLDANVAAQDQAPAVGSLLASRLAESPRVKVITQSDIATMLGIEKQRQLFKAATCSSESCMAEISGAVGARYVVSGRVDRFGSRYIVTATVFDSIQAKSLAKPRAEANNDEALPAAAEKISREVLMAVGVQPPGLSIAAQNKASPTGFVLSLKGGSNFFQSLKSLSPSAQIELGYRFHPEWIGFLQIGVTFAIANNSGPAGTVSVVPSIVGVRHLYLIDHSLQPYWGLGLGLQLSFGQYGIFQSSGPLPTLIGLIGFQYLITQHLGALAELGTNVAQTILGVVGGSNVGSGFNLNLNLGIVYRF